MSPIQPLVCRCYLFAIRFIICHYKYSIYFALANRNALFEKKKKQQQQQQALSH